MVYAKMTQFHNFLYQIWNPLEKGKMYVQLSAMRAFPDSTVYPAYVYWMWIREVSDAWIMYCYSTDDRSEVERSLDGRGLRASASELAAYATADTARPSGQVSV